MRPPSLAPRLGLLILLAAACWLSACSLAPALDASLGSFHPLQDTALGPGDLLFDDFVIPNGITVGLQSSTVIIVRGRTQIDGTLAADSGPLILEARGDLEINGTLSAIQHPSSLTVGDEPQGIKLLVLGGLTIGPAARLETNGHLFIVDHPSRLTRSPAQIARDTDNPPHEAASFGLAAPDAPIFNDQQEQIPDGRSPAADRPGEPVRLSGRWELTSFPGAQQVVLLDFTRPHDLLLINFNFQADTAADGETAAPNSGVARGEPGRPGVRLFVSNAGGQILLRQVVIDLGAGGAGGRAVVNCGNAFGGPGGESGGLRFASAVGITLEEVLINPGRAGAGGEAWAGCDRPGGSAARALGGPGGAIEKQLYAWRVDGLENLALGPAAAGNGGMAFAYGADGESGLRCEKGQDGGSATASGGEGGAAVISIGELPVQLSPPLPGEGGSAAAAGGTGGDALPCACQAVAGGSGGAAEAIGGSAGASAAPAAPVAVVSSTAAAGQSTSDACSQAMDVYQGGDLHAALAMLDRLLENQPEFAEAYVRRAVLLIELGLPGSARQDLRLALEINPEDPAAYYELGVAEFGLGREDEALSAFQTALSFKPRYAEAFYGMAVIHDARGDAILAIDAYEKFLAIYTINDAVSSDVRQRISELQNP